MMSSVDTNFFTQIFTDFWDYFYQSSVKWNQVVCEAKILLDFKTFIARLTRIISMVIPYLDISLSGYLMRIISMVILYLNILWLLAAAVVILEGALEMSPKLTWIMILLSYNPNMYIAPYQNVYMKCKRATGWSKETVYCNIFQTDLKISKSAITQWFLETLYHLVLVFWCLKHIK